MPPSSPLLPRAPGRANALAAGLMLGASAELLPKAGEEGSTRIVAVVTAVSTFAMVGLQTVLVS